jgi:hypothetical protein
MKQGTKIPPKINPKTPSPLKTGIFPTIRERRKNLFDSTNGIN